MSLRQLTSWFCVVDNCLTDLELCYFPNVQVQWSNFDKLELGSGEIREVLLLTYLNGFQVWDVQDANNVHELVSRRDGPVAFLRLQPKPIVQESIDGVVDFKGARPLLLVVTSDGTGSGSPGAAGFSGGYGTGGGGTSLGSGASHLVPTVVRFYSLRNHSYVHTLRFSRAIHAVRCSPRVVAVALATQVMELLLFDCTSEVFLLFVLCATPCFFLTFSTLQVGIAQSGF